MSKWFFDETLQQKKTVVKRIEAARDKLSTGVKIIGGSTANGGACDRGAVGYTTENYYNGIAVCGKYDDKFEIGFVSVVSKSSLNGRLDALFHELMYLESNYDGSSGCPPSNKKVGDCVYGVEKSLELQPSSKKIANASNYQYMFIDWYNNVYLRRSSDRR